MGNMGESLIEGIGNEVLIYCGTLLVVIAIAIFVGRRRYFPSDLTSRQFSSERAGRTYDSEICPICISPHRLGVETNCGHKFCGQCIQSYLINRPSRDSLFASSSLPCPMCRQNINLLMTSFSPDESVDEAERREVMLAVYEYNVRFGSGPRSWMTYIRDCPVLIRHMFSEFFTLGGLLWLFRLRVIICLVPAVVYLLIPSDIIPETLFGFLGLIDDILVVYLCALYLSILYRRYLLSRANEVEM